MEFKAKIISKCPACGGRSFKFIAQVHDDRFGQPDSFRIKECRTCGLGVLHPSLKPEALNRLYQKYYSSPPAAPYPRRSAPRIWVSGRLALARAWIHRDAELWRWAGKGESVLDVGCGAGWPRAVLALLKSDYLGLEITDSGCAAMAGDGVPFLQGDLAAAKGKLHKRFDLVAMSQVLEHVPDPARALRLAGQMLAPGGRILVSSPNWNSRFRLQEGPCWLHYHAPYHLWHFNRGNLELLAAAAGLRLSSFFSLTPTLWRCWQKQRPYPPRGRKNNYAFGEPGFKARLAAWPGAWAADRAGEGEAFVARLEKP